MLAMTSYNSPFFEHQLQSPISHWCMQHPTKWWFLRGEVNPVQMLEWIWNCSGFYSDTKITRINHLLYPNCPTMNRLIIALWQTGSWLPVQAFTCWRTQLTASPNHRFRLKCPTGPCLLEPVSVKLEEFFSYPSIHNYACIITATYLVINLR